MRPDRKVEATGKGMRFQDFVQQQLCVTARLEEAHVLALRLYTTAAFVSINSPLRDAARTQSHPLAATVWFLSEGIKQLRACGSYQADAQREVTLWRGMKNLRLDEGFLRKGGSERAPMSTTSSLQVAAAYSSSECSLFFKLKTASFMERGVNIVFLSAFPAEAEFLFSPLTYLLPTGKTQEMQVNGSQLTIVEVQPKM